MTGALNVSVSTASRNRRAAATKSAGILRFQVIDVTAVGLGERRAFDEENVLGVELGAPREVVRACDDGVVDDQDLVMHEVVAAGRTVRRGIFSSEMSARNELLERWNFPMVRIQGTSK